MDYLQYMRTNHGITFYITLISVDFAQCEIYHAKVKVCDLVKGVISYSNLSMDQTSILISQN